MLLTLVLSLWVYIDESEGDVLGCENTDLDANSEASVGSGEKRYEITGSGDEGKLKHAE